jgi:hypothetical protein
LLRAQRKTCAKIEMERFGQQTFYDFSAEKRQATFDVAKVDEVMAEYEPLIYDCLHQGARANLTNDTHDALAMGVTNDGRVKGLDIRPTRLRGTSVEACLSRAIEQFRYPRYRGEMQHVSVGFDVGDMQGG